MAHFVLLKSFPSSRELAKIFTREVFRLHGVPKVYFTVKKQKEGTSENQTIISQFTVQCFSDMPELQIPIFVIFLFIFLIIIIGNITVFATITLNSHLHRPMYVFLSNLSILDVSCTSTILPKLLVMLFTQQKTISFAGCMIQLYFFISFTGIEFFLLAAMAFDRYMAICYPHYPLFMSLKHCAQIVTAVWATGLLDSITHFVFIVNLSFCSSHHIDHFFCDVTALVKLTCSDTSIIEILTYINGALVGLGAFLLIFISYIFIICTIINIKSSEGRKKSFSTCASHLTCVIIFYGTIIILYMRPTSTYSPMKDKFFSLLYIVLIPILNPFIYKDFKDSVQKLKTKFKFCI
ncbi:olfactory receptor 5AR1-like [Rhinophrynus dorsalis]